MVVAVLANSVWDAWLAAALAGVLAALVVGLGEWLHARRRARVGYLAFGSSGRPRMWVKGTGVARSLAVGALLWGLVTLLGLDGAPAQPDPLERTNRRVLICLDVSPSMKLKDSGDGGLLTRAARARQVVRSMMQRADLSGARVSVVAFYNGAKPVVVDTWDMNIIWNIFDDLPLEYAFEDGPTKMYAGVREAAVMAERWPVRSTSLVIVSDGDTLPASEAPRLPPSIGSTLVLGVGSPHRGLQIAGRSSRQDTSSLRQLAARLSGRYLDVNTRHVPTSFAAGLWPSGDGGKADSTVLAWALACVAMGSGVLALLDPALILWGAKGERRWVHTTKRKRTSAGGGRSEGVGRRRNTRRTRPTSLGVGVQGVNA